MSYFARSSLKFHELFSLFSEKFYKAFNKDKYFIGSSPQSLYKIEHVSFKMFEMIFEDMILDDVWVKFDFDRKPLYGFRMQPILPENFKKARQLGGQKNVDFLKTNFSSVQLTLFDQQNTSKGEYDFGFPIMLPSRLHNLMITKLNEGKTWSQNKRRTISDYYNRFRELFPRISYEEYIRIANFILTNVKHITDKRIPVQIHSGGQYIVFKPRQYRTAKEKREGMSRKMYFLYKKYNKVFNGYYYIALNKERYEEFKKANKGKIKYYEFTDIQLFKIRDEALITCPNTIKLFKIKQPLELPFFITKKHFKIEKARVESIEDIDAPINIVTHPIKLFEKNAKRSDKYVY